MEISKIAIGAMRFNDRRSAVEVLRKAIDCGFNYIDTSPGYCYKDEVENSESWVGEAINNKDYRERVMVSTKSATSNGGLEIGNKFELEKGFGIRTAQQFQQIFAQSLKRLNLPAIDYYHLWICHTEEQFQDAMKPGGWYDGYQQHKEKVPHFGITTHADADTVIKFLESSLFKTVTIPLNVINSTRLPVVKYCQEKNITVIAMNPMGGGLLAANDRLKELALRYLMALDNVHPIIGFAAVEEVEYAKWIEDTTKDFRQTADEIQAEVRGLIDTQEQLCTSCGYCQPCPQFINIGVCLSHYNLYKYLDLEAAKERFSRWQWNPRYNLKNCVACGDCETRCPNNLPIRELIEDAKVLLYND